MGSLRRSLRRSTVIFFALSLLGTTLLAGLAAAQGGGNSTAAALCRGEGYKSLTTADGTPFASVGECINYAAQNGGASAIATITPTPSPTEIPPSPTPTELPPTPTPVPLTSLTLVHYPTTDCSARATATGLAHGQPYVIALDVTANGVTDRRSVDVPATHLGYYSYSVDYYNFGVERQFEAYLYDSGGNLLAQAGPITITDPCLATQ